MRLFKKIKELDYLGIRYASVSSCDQKPTNSRPGLQLDRIFFAKQVSLDASLSKCTPSPQKRAFGLVMTLTSDLEKPF